MTETQVEMKVDYGCCEMQENHAFGDLAYENLKEAELPVFDEPTFSNCAALAKELPPNLTTFFITITPREFYNVSIFM